MDKLMVCLLNKELLRLHNMVNGSYRYESEYSYSSKEKEIIDQTRRDWAMKQIEVIHKALMTPVILNESN